MKRKKKLAWMMTFIIALATIPSSNVLAFEVTGEGEWYQEDISGKTGTKYTFEQLYDDFLVNEQENSCSKTR